MKIKFNAFFFSLLVTYSSYSMNKTEEEMFKENLSKLNESLVAFLNDFKDWPKREQDKIKLFSNSGGVSFHVRGATFVDDKFAGGVAWLLQSYITTDQRIPFFLAIDYLKNQKRTK